MLQFDEDLRHWVREVSEHFHVKIFFKEMIGQLLFTFFGPAVTPILLGIYGKKAGLINRYFWPRRDAIVIYILSLCLIAGTLGSVLTLIIYRPSDITDIEVKFFCMMVVMRVVTICFKYAYMSSATWRRLNKKRHELSFLSSLLLIGGWDVVDDEMMLKYAEMSFIGIIGSRCQRDSLYLQFVAWPNTRDDLTALRHRIDGTTKSLFFRPTGLVWQKNFSRKAVMSVNSLRADPNSTNRTSSQNSTDDTSPEQDAQTKAALDEVIETAEDSDEEIPTLENVNFGKKLPMDDCDKQVFTAAGNGEMVALTDLFLYILRATLRTERAFVKEWAVRRYLFLASIATVLFPCICRSISGKHFLGETWASTVVIVGPWPLLVITYWGNLLFTYIAAKDMWRRRSLMHSCSALLSFQRHYRKHCPAEIDSLPVVDMTDPHSIEAWRKLRQLCQDWGRFFFWRIQGFTTMFLACVVVSCLDLVAKVTLPTWTEASNVNLMHILLTLFPAACVEICIISQVILGHCVNQAADHHSFLLNRHRLVLMSARQRTAADAVARGGDVPSNDDSLQRAIEFLEVLTADIDGEHRSNPVKLVGLYCGYSLLSVLYVIPFGVLTSLFNFCVQEETSWRCQSVG